MDDLLSIAGGSAHANAPLNTLIGLTILGMAPFLLVLMTSFVRIIVVFSLVRQAMGTQSLPPNTVLTGLALILTFLIMTPTLQKMSATAITPYAHGQINQRQLFDRGILPLRDFMLKQTREHDLQAFMKVGHLKPGRREDVPIVALIPAYVVGELRAAFVIGFALYLPFLAIDLAVASILMALGMMMLSPPIISLPCKLLLFVMVDGWSLICMGLATSYR
jgi:flagellar biosynthetic protein FliP